MTREKLSDFIANEHTILSDAMAIIDVNGNGILFVVGDDLILRGAVSDGDIRRWLLKAGSLDAEIGLLMNPYPKFVSMEQRGEAQKLLRRYQVRALPVVDDEQHIEDIILAKDWEQESEKEQGGLEDVSVIIMAGGKGTRLYPYTKVLPKPLIPIGDIPIVERIIDRYHQYGVIDFFMTVNYRKNMIKSYFSELEKNYHVEFVEEDKPLGTAGSLKLLNRTFSAPIFVANCDILIQTDYADLYRFHKESGNAITIVTAMKNVTIPYGVIQIKESGEIERMVEKPKHSYLVNTGMYIINPDIIDLIPDDTFFHMTHLVEAAIEHGFRVGMYPVSEDSFLDMGEFEEMKRMEDKLNLK